jgi:hypothetical protein
MRKNGEASSADRLLAGALGTDLLEPTPGCEKCDSGFELTETMLSRWLFPWLMKSPNVRSRFGVLAAEVGAVE